MITIQIDASLIYPPTSTPWGKPQQSRMIAPGVWCISTASHGGYYVAPEVREKFPECFRQFGTWAGPGWFEEDCDVCLVELAMPECFDGRCLYYALSMVRSSREYFAAINLDEYLATDKGRMAKSKAAEWYADNWDKYEFGCMMGDANGCSGQLRRVDGGDNLRYRCTQWPRVSAPFTLQEAKDSGLTIDRI